MASRIWEFPVAREFPKPREIPVTREFPRLKLFPPISRETGISWLEICWKPSLECMQTYSTVSSEYLSILALKNGVGWGGVLKRSRVDPPCFILYAHVDNYVQRQQRAGLHALWCSLNATSMYIACSRCNQSVIIVVGCIAVLCVMTLFDMHIL